MKQVFELTKRNMRLFLRDKATVFFSFLSSIILVALYFLFIASLFMQGFEQSDSGLSSSDINFVVYLQMMAGVLILNSLSLSLGAFITAAKDFETRRVDNFLLTPLSAGKLLASYLLGGFAVSFALNALTWCGAALLIGILTGQFITAATLFTGLGVLAAASAISGAIMLLITAVIRSSGALGVISGIAGTFFGFLCGIYMPYSELGEGTAKFGSLLPYTHLTIWFKQVVLGDAFERLSITGEWREILLDEIFSAENLGLAGLDISLPVMLFLCGVFGVACLTAAFVVLRKRMRRV
ncbi:MAG: ABC transporter permease [Oscillospiraceae bacterium]|nr:ABC transporter permease [Oscillospiraceae bacterium]